MSVLFIFDGMVSLLNWKDAKQKEFLYTSNGYSSVTQICEHGAVIECYMESSCSIA